MPRTLKNPVAESDRLAAKLDAARKALRLARRQRDNCAAQHRDEQRRVNELSAQVEMLGRDKLAIQLESDNWRDECHRVSLRADELKAQLAQAEARIDMQQERIQRLERGTLRMVELLP